METLLLSVAAPTRAIKFLAAVVFIFLLLASHAHAQEAIQADFGCADQGSGWWSCWPYNGDGRDSITLFGVVVQFPPDWIYVQDDGTGQIYTEDQGNGTSTIWWHAAPGQAIAPYNAKAIQFYVAVPTQGGDIGWTVAGSGGLAATFGTTTGPTPQ